MILRRLGVKTAETYHYRALLPDFRTFRLPVFRLFTAAKGYNSLCPYAGILCPHILAHMPLRMT
jgi:hypothetical protein